MIAKITKTAFIIFASLLTPALAQIESGTSVQITIMGVPAEEKGKIDAVYPVGQNGTVNMPFIGQIRAAGLRPESLASSIQNAYRSAQIYTSPTIQVIDTQGGMTAKALMVHAGGQVRRPGPISFQKNLTIYQAVQAAGGATEFGSLKRVKLYRDGKTTTYDLTNSQFMRIPLKPNDTIEVPQKNWLGR
ncbi:MAG: polysaccharide biosynthesis/export family protein [Luteolibacter sp.]